MLAMIAAITLSSGGEIATISVAIVVVCGATYRALRARARKLTAEQRRAKATDDFVWGKPADPPYSEAVPGAAEMLLQLQQGFKELEGMMDKRIEWERRHDKRVGVTT